MMIRQCAILFGCLALGELLIYFTHIPLPSSILGMLIFKRNVTSFIYKFHMYCLIFGLVI